MPALTRTILATTATAIALSLGVPAQAAAPLPEPTPTTDIDVSLGWYVYVRLNKNEVKTIPDSVLVAGGGTLAAYLCPKIPHALAKAACGAAAGLYIGSVIGTLRDAKKANQCVELRYNHMSAILVGWRGYNC